MAGPDRYRIYFSLYGSRRSYGFFKFRGGVKANLQRIFLGFAAGVMIAASVWSLDTID